VTYVGVGDVLYSINPRYRPASRLVHTASYDVVLPCSTVSGSESALKLPNVAVASRRYSSYVVPMVVSPGAASYPPTTKRVTLVPAAMGTSRSRVSPTASDFSTVVALARPLGAMSCAPL
jgi:hypothetical protein